MKEWNSSVKRTVENFNRLFSMRGRSIGIFAPFLIVEKSNSEIKLSLQLNPQKILLSVINSVIILLKQRNQTPTVHLIELTSNLVNLLLYAKNRSICLLSFNSTISVRLLSDKFMLVLFGEDIVNFPSIFIL